MSSDSGEDVSSSELGYSSDESIPKRSKRSTTSKTKTGVDESLGKDNELFGVDVKSVTALEKGLGPHKLGKQSTSLFLEQIDDMTAYPRHTHHKTSESLGEFVEAVTDLGNQGQSKQGGVRDTGWKHKSRNALGNIKNAEDLNAALTYLLEEQHTILETFQGDLESVLLGANATENIATDVASSSLALRIGRDTLHSFINLMNHLSGVHNTRGWEYCDTQLKYHASKIGLIRGKYRYRIQVVCKIYIYLRDGQAKNWLSLKLQSAEIRTLRAQMTNQTSEGSNQGYSCSHCKSTLHGGGRTACPWKDKSGSEAKKGAAAFMLRMSTGGGESPTVPP